MVVVPVGVGVGVCTCVGVGVGVAVGLGVGLCAGSSRAVSWCAGGWMWVGVGRCGSVLVWEWLGAGVLWVGVVVGECLGVDVSCCGSGSGTSTR